MNPSTGSADFRASRTRFPPAPVEDASKVAVEGETWDDRILGALPLFVVGVACVVVALELYSTGTTTILGGSTSVRLRPWLLFLALGITGISVGIVSLFLEEEEPEPLRPVPTPVVPRPAATPAWDESLIEPEPKVPVSRRTWETPWASFEDRATPPPTSDAVLRQIEEIETSLRKKSRAPPPE